MSTEMYCWGNKDTSFSHHSTIATEVRPRQKYTINC